MLTTKLTSQARERSNLYWLVAEGDSLRVLRSSMMPKSALDVWAGHANEFGGTVLAVSAS